MTRGLRAAPTASWLALLALLACADKPDSAAPLDSAPPLTAALAEAGDPRIVEVGQPLTLDGSASVGVSFLWDFGDGQTAEGAVVEHAWSEPGLYSAVLQATGEDGGRRSDSVRVTVHLPLSEHPARSSGTLAWGREALWVLTPEADALTRVDPDTLSAQVFDTCEGPSALAVEDGVVVVSCAGSAQVQRFNEDGDLLDTTDLTENSMPRGVVCEGPRCWVALQATGQVAELSADGDVTLHEALPDPFALALVPGQDTPTLSRWRAPDAGGELGRLGEAPWILAIDTRPDSDTTTGGVPNLIEQLLPSPDGSRLYVPAVQHNLRRGLVLSGEALSHETAMVAVLLTLNAETGEELSRRQFDDKGRAIAVASSPEGNLLYVLHPGTATVTVLDAFSGALVGSIREVGVGARALVVSPDGDTLYVHAWLDRELRAFDVSDLSVNPPLVGAAALLEVEPLSPELLLGKRLFYDSGDFRLTRDGYIACAHCHPDGRDDGRTWDFTDRGEGLRNTTSLEGRAGTAMGRVHWTGNFDEIQDFENDIRLHFAGAGLLSEDDWAAASDPLGPAKAGRSADLDALAAYVTSLDATPPSPFAAPEGGEAAFTAAGCAVCHPAPLYTDSSLSDPLRHDVGTLTEASGQRLGEPLDGLDTPTLLGSWDTAPYLHDGSAATLQEAIEAHAIELTEEQLAEIAGFVQSL